MSLKYPDMRTLMMSLIFTFSHFGILPFVHAESLNEAFYIEPMIIQISPDASVPTALEVFNKENHAAEIHIDVFERSDTLNGAEKRAVTKDVTIETSNFKLEAGQSKKLAVAYRGSRKIARERAFRIVVRQVGASEDNSLDVRFVYVASMYVTPKFAASKLVVRHVHRASEREVEVTLYNQGMAHVEMSKMTFVILQSPAGGPEREIEISSASRQKLAKQNLLAGSSRKIKLEIGPEEKPVPNGLLTLKFTSQDLKRNSE